jgi:hypothetical protein
MFTISTLQIRPQAPRPSQPATAAGTAASARASDCSLLHPSTATPSTATPSTAPTSERARAPSHPPAAAAATASASDCASSQSPAAVSLPDCPLFESWPPAVISVSDCPLLRFPTAASTSNCPLCQFLSRPVGSLPEPAVLIPVASPQQLVSKKPGPKRQPITAAPRWIPPATATPSRAKRSRDVSFKLAVLSWLKHTQLDNGKGGLRKPTREEAKKRFGLKSKWQINKWKQDEERLIEAKGKTKRIRQKGVGRWPLLEKQLVKLFAERRLAGRVVRRRWFERTAKQIHAELYPHSAGKFCFSNGWFSRFLARNEITMRVLTNKAQEAPEEYFEVIINFLCFNRRN